MTDGRQIGRSDIAMLMAIGVVLLLPMLAFPLNTDHATFLRGGLAIFKGSTLYVDFIDVKPPLVFVIFGIAGSVLGTGEIAIRIFDLVWQSATILALVFLLRSYYSDRRTIGIVVASYAVLYITLHWSQTLQVETLLGLPLVVAMLLHQRERTLVRNVVIGICFAAMILLKFTFGIIAAMFVLHAVLTAPNRRHMAADIAQWVGGSMLGLAVMLLPFLVQPGFLDGWALAMQFIGTYSAYPPLSMELVRNGLKMTGSFLGDNLSIVMTASVIMGSAIAVLRSADERLRSFVALNVLILVGLLFTVAIERKFAPYHYSRIFLTTAILAGVWMSYAASQWRSWFEMSSLRSRTLLVIGLTLATMFSPIPRYLSAAALSARSLGGGHPFESYMTSRAEGNIDFIGIRQLQSYASTHFANNDQTLLMSVTASMVAPYLPEQTPSAFADSHIYFAVGAHEVWKQRALDEMRRANHLVIDTADRHGLVNLHDRTSYESVQHDERFSNVLRERFVFDTVISTFRIYHRHTTP